MSSSWEKNKNVWGVVGAIVSVLMGAACSFFSIIAAPLVVVGGLITTSALLGLTIVREGTAKAVMRFGGFHRFMMAWKGHRFNEEWNVVEDPGARSASGLRWIGFWPIHRLHRYTLRWRGVELINGEETIVQHSEELDYIWLRPDVYHTLIKKAETRPPERIPVDAEFLLTLQTVNPYKTYFVAPSNWVENVMVRWNARFRAWVATKGIDEVLKASRESIWRDLGNDPLLVWLEENWGVKTLEKGIDPRDISMTEEYQKAAAAEQQRVLEARGLTSQTFGAIINMVAEMTRESGQTPQQRADILRKEFRDNPEGTCKKYEKLLEKAVDFVNRDRAIAGKALIDIRTTPGGNPFLDLIAAWRRMPTGGGGGGGTEEEESDEELMKKVARGEISIKEAGRRKQRETQKK